MREIIFHMFHKCSYLARATPPPVLMHRRYSVIKFSNFLASFLLFARLHMSGLVSGHSRLGRTSDIAELPVE